MNHALVLIFDFIGGKRRTSRKERLQSVFILLHWFCMGFDQICVEAAKGALQNSHALSARRHVEQWKTSRCSWSYADAIFPPM